MKRVIVAPLDWGLGHATRCIPVIRALLQHQCVVMIASCGDALLLLKEEFPTLTFFNLPAYRPVYSNGSMVMALTKQIPKFIKVINQEHRVLEAIISQHNIDLVISDNRYGCWSAQVPCVFITHQSNILMPKRFGWLAPVVRWLNEKMMMKFTRCWVPDFEGDKSLAGNLISFGSMMPRIHRRYVGPLSRFISSGNKEKTYDLLCIFSGPEPQRTVLDKLVTTQVKQMDLRTLIVRGLPSENNAPTIHGSIEMVDFMNSEQLQKAIESSEVVIARSGFSTVMDLSRLGGKIIFIPTPGQPEQLYLAKTLHEKGIAFSMSQKDFNLKLALHESEKFKGFTPTMHNDELLKLAIEEILSQ